MKIPQAAWSLVIGGLLVPGASAETPAAPLPKTESVGWSFSLLPKAFQSNPALEMTVITEMTELGKKEPLVSPEKPAYYATQSSGYRTFGEGNAGKTIGESEVEGVLRHALSANGYLPATPGHTPTVAIFYFWGAHTLLDQDNPALSDERWTNNILDRAALAGGEKFAAELSHAIKQSDEASAASSTHLGGSADDSMSNMGAAAALAQMNAVMNPVKLLGQRSIKYQMLIDQASSDCYFVVASAYDYASLATPKKRLLWRTRMTVNATGVSQVQSLPALIASASPYFGRDMSEAETLTRRVVREGNVEIGTPTVVETAAPAGAPAKKP